VIAAIVVAACWAILAVGFVHSHRPGSHARPAGPIRTDRGSDLGLALQLGAVAAILFFRRTGPVPMTLQVLAGLLAPASVILAWKSVLALGRHWRVRAVVTADHELVTRGPYARLRHPVYTAFLGMLVSSALVFTELPATAAIVAVFIAGTEIRIRSEERLLAERFGDDYRRYRSAVRAYIPFVR
jgi:protein-S-isoprenylcysteine O-methyltransferase Ste14